MGLRESGAAQSRGLKTPLTVKRSTIEFVHGTDVTLEVYVEGAGPALVVLPSYGRDGGADFDYFVSKVGAAGFTVLRPPAARGVAGSKGTIG